MFFDATPQNITTLLVVALAAVAFTLLLRGRYDSNLPLLYYSTAVVVGAFLERPLHPFLLLGGIASALVLRFEFMNKGVTKFFGLLTTIMIFVSAAGLLDQVFGDGRFQL